MKLISFALALAVSLVGAGGALAQPESKLVSRLDKAMVQAIWCSSLLFEESYYHETGSDEASRYEDLAFELGDAIDAMLLDEHGMRQAEVDEIWSMFDAGAYDLAEADEESFLAQLEICENNFDALL